MAGRILVLDDEENYAEMLQDLLRDHNFRVDMATRPERAIDQLEEIPYDLVISDYKMPVMDGADFLKRSRELYPNLPFILVSGLMNTPELVKVANMGVTLVMEKPLDTAEFLRQVARFSEPMTAEERRSLELERESSGAQTSGVAFSHPEEPRFFSAVSFSGKRFIQNAWAIASEGRDLFILQTPGADGELAAKDISAWLGNSDLPVAAFDLPDSNGAALKKLSEVLSGQEHSRAVCVYLNTASQLAQAHDLTEVASKELRDVAEDFLLIYILESDGSDSCLAEAGGRAIILPALAERPSDVAAYARRFARILSERVGKKKCCTFTPEAAYLLLAHDWRRGYREVQEVVMQAVESSEGDEAINAERLKNALGIEEDQVVSPEARLPILMKKAQHRYLEKEMLVGGMTVAELAGELELEKPVETRDALKDLPLIKAELGSL